MNEILSSNLSEKCPREIGILFKSYFNKVFSERADFTAQYRYEYR